MQLQAIILSPVRKRAVSQAGGDFGVGTAQLRLQRGPPRLSANRLGQGPRPVRRCGDREQEVAELHSKVPVRDERNKRKKVYR